MKKLLLIAATVFFVQFCNAQDVTGPYFGQTPPDKTPTLFAPGIVSLPNISEIRVIFSPDGNECFFTKSSPNNAYPWYLYYMKCVNNVWTSPALAPFQPQKSTFAGQPFFSAKGDKLYYMSDADSTAHIWVVQRTLQGWGSPQLLDSPINVNNAKTVYYSETLDSTAYFASDRPGGYGLLDIWRTRKVIGQPLEVENLGTLFNTSDYDYDPCIEPHGRYLLFARGGAVYVSYNNGKGGWKVPLNMNNIIPGFNTGGAYGPSISPDGKYIFWGSYYSGQPDIYWVSAGYIDSLKNINFPPYVNRVIPNQMVMQDSMFNYQVPDSTFIDDDGNNTLTYSATLSNNKPLPMWLSFNAASRIFTGTPDSIGTFTIKITAIDTANVSASCQFRITVVTGPTGVKEDNGQLPKESILFQNYPNPFNPSTTIYYSLAKSSFVKLNIYNLLGQKIRTLQNTFQTAGEHSLVWDASDEKNNNVSSGVYLYTLETDYLTLQKKLVLVR